MKIWLSLHINEELLESIAEHLIKNFNLSHDDLYIDEEHLCEDNIEKTEPLKTMSDLQV